MVDQIQPHMEDGRIEPLIIVFQFFKPNRWKEFRTRLIGDTPSNSVRIAQVSSQGRSSGIVELRRGTTIVKTIEQVMTLEEACTCCDKKVEEGNNEKYKCKNCKTNEAEAELRYKVEVVACDGIGGISLLLWDTQRSDNVYSVATMCDDEYIVTMNFSDDFEVGTSKVVPDNVYSNEVNEDLGVVSLEQTNEKGAVVSMMDDSVTKINMKTPGKRSATSVKHCASQQPKQEVDGQYSTNRFSKKGLKRGKMQLNDKKN
ncbi:hypothetical protein PIB30_068256 [Stylosanthes scabra]|uniref:Replication factor A C-terminal domain-containing protein n=1 Tax=Stylosanthes scabra TaxID=79078 RepID=A0ABU6VNS3_9FABA|nr:hypothetical protein [Stylosanthes scabra]